MKSLALIALLGISYGAFAAPTRQNERPRRPGVILYKMRENAAGMQSLAGFNKNSFLKKYRLKVEKRILSVEVAKQEMQRTFGAAAAPSATEEEIAADMMASGLVEFAEPDYLLKPAYTPNDRHFRSQWHHNAIRSMDAWNHTMGDRRVKVLVCDTGVEATHSDLKGHLQLPGINTADGSRNTGAVNLHGTAVAGTLGAVADNASGVAGVAGNVTIIPGRVTNQSNGSAYLSDMAECVRWGGDNKVKVVNLSYSGAESPTIDAAAKYLRARGGLLIMAAGNENRNISSFPDYGSFLLVGAVGENLQRASFSNYGTPVDIVAPGVNILTTIPGNKYTYINGTSFASPVVAGAAALIWSFNPSFTPADVERILLNSTNDIGRSGEDSTYGRGLLNLAKAADLALRTKPGSAR